MKMRRILLTLAPLAILAGCGGAGENADVPEAEPAEATSAEIGDFTVHFSAQATADVPQDIAVAYGLTRTKNDAMLTVSIIRKSDSLPVAGDVLVKAVNLTGQLKTVRMRRIDEQDAIYYIGVTNVDNRETLIFDIEVTPEGSSDTASLRFKRQFFTD